MGNLLKSFLSWIGVTLAFCFLIFLAGLLWHMLLTP